MNFQCPVCGYSELPRPVQDELICACCGTHFGYHDYGSTYEELRFNWIARGAQWFSRSIRPPNGWDPVKQLADARMLLRVGCDPAPVETNQIDLVPNEIRPWTLAA